MTVEDIFHKLISQTFHFYFPPFLPSFLIFTSFLNITGQYFLEDFFVYVKYVFMAFFIFKYVPLRVCPGLIIWDLKYILLC